MVRYGETLSPGGQACLTGVMDPWELDAAFAAVERADFLPTGSRGQAGTDAPVPIGQGQTNSQPRIVKTMLELLDARQGHRVLDVGAGSGWTTALLARLVGPTGQVIGIELEPELAAWGAANLGHYEMPWASEQVADPGVLGAPGRAPYDRILVSAAARAIPPELVEQLERDGVMVLPVDSMLTRVTRVGVTADDVEVSTHGGCRFVPLR